MAVLNVRYAMTTVVLLCNVYVSTAAILNPVTVHTFSVSDLHHLPDLFGCDPCQVVPVRVRDNTTTTGSISDKCLECICQAESGCSLSSDDECSDRGTESVCGYFAMSRSYYSACGQPNGKSAAKWMDCAGDKPCAEDCVRTYVEDIAETCAASVGPPTCETYARVHRGGTDGCDGLTAQDFWERVQECMED